MGTAGIVATEAVATAIVVTEAIAEAIAVTEAIAKAIAVTEAVAKAIVVTEAVATAIVVTEAIAEAIVATEAIAEAIVATDPIAGSNRRDLTGVSKTVSLTDATTENIAAAGGFKVRWDKGLGSLSQLKINDLRKSRFLCTSQETGTLHIFRWDTVQTNPRVPMRISKI